MKAWLFLREIPLLVWLGIVAAAYWLFGPEMRAARRMKRLRKKNEEAGEKDTVWLINMRTGTYRRMR